MPQETNLNVSPYFDDFDPQKNYYKVLFKPGYPVQARELTTLQTTLQNQIEKFGSNIFRDGSIVIPGGINYIQNFYAVELKSNYLGINLNSYLEYTRGKVIRGERSGVRARILYSINSNESERGNYTIYVNYINSDYSTSSIQEFFADETLILEETLVVPSTLQNASVTIQSGQGFSTTISGNPNSIGSAVTIYSGVYYLRGYFVDVSEEIVLLDQYNNTPSYKVGFEVVEDIITSDLDSSLNDNSKGFSNYTSPGADRLSIKAVAKKTTLNNSDIENFVSLIEIENGLVKSIKKDPQLNVLESEFARRTYDESGDYYIQNPNIIIKDTLNDRKGNNGLYFDNQLTTNGFVPSESIGSYQITPFKAYVKGYKVETIIPTFLDFSKPRTTKTLDNQSINYTTGSTYTLNRVYGSPNIGISTNYVLTLRDQRVGSSSTAAAGKEIGLSRVYDFALESGSYDNSTPETNQWDISLFDTQLYTEITLSEPISLTVPTYIKGKSSGAIGFLRFNVTNSGVVTAYSTKGTFLVGEKFTFDGIENTRIAKTVKTYTNNDVKSLHGTVGTAYTFSGDVIQSPYYQVGLVNITPNNAGISTVTSAKVNFTGIATVGNLVSFSKSGLTVNTFARIESISSNTLTISGVTTVPGVCDGGLPSSAINPSDFTILNSRLQFSLDNSLYTSLPRKNVSNVNLQDSQITIRKQYDVTITNGATQTITAGADETFLPFDEERYVLIRRDGGTEILTLDRFVFASGSTQLTIIGLSGSGSAKLIATLRKTSVKEKIKNRTKVKSLIINRSKYNGSGIGATTLNDGLLYGSYPYGTRVQDEDICLLEPDVTKIHGIFESNDTSDPTLPSLVFSTINSPNNKTGDLVLGSEIIGESSGAVAIYCERIDNFKIGIVYLNDNRFQNSETVRFADISVTAIISQVNDGDNNITNNFILDNGQRETIYDYSKITRKTGFKEPAKKIRVIYESADFSSSDEGDIITVNSYQQFDYKDIPTINNNRNSDLIDIRPRTSNFDISNTTRSPFEFLSRDFTQTSSSPSNVLASDESINLGFSYYLGRIDKIFISSNGTVQLSSGSPSENPQMPQPMDNAIEIATAFLPPYLYDISQVDIKFTDYKRYAMSDIAKLEDRIKKLETYTTLTLLETDTSNLSIKDENGLDRFKSGFFVDDFSTTKFQRKETIVKNSIDIKNGELRPAPYTTSLDLLLATKNISNQNTDSLHDVDLLGVNTKKSGKIITLDYTEVDEIIQPYATRAESVTPNSISFYGGTIELTPSSDVWVDTVRTAALITEENGSFTETRSQITASQLDNQSGFSPVLWNSWQTVWTGENKTSRLISDNNNTRTFQESITKTGTSTRTGTRSLTRTNIETKSLGDRVISSNIIPYMRSRNIEFVSKRLKPFTRVYSSFDGVSVDNYIIPKLIEISMISGVFQVGETVVGSVNDSAVTLNSESQIKFRVAKSNHKFGPYNFPIEIYFSNPYQRNLTIPNEYSSTSTILNVDTFSLSNQVQGNYYGNIRQGMKLRGLTSGAEATVRSVRLITDSTGCVIGSFFIPNPNVNTNPAFVAGSKVFKLSNVSLGSQVGNITTTNASEIFLSRGKIDTIQENIVSVRNVRVEVQTVVDIQSASTTTTNIINVPVVIPDPPAPPPQPIPQISISPTPAPPPARSVQYPAISISQWRNWLINDVDPLDRSAVSRQLSIIDSLQRQNPNLRLTQFEMANRLGGSVAYNLTFGNSINASGPNPGPG